MHDDDDDYDNDDDNSVASEESLDSSIHIDNNNDNYNNNNDNNNQVVDTSFWSEPYTTTTYTTTTNNYSHNHHDKYNRYNNNYNHYNGSSSSNSGSIKYKIEMKHKFSPLPITDILFSNNGGNYIAIVYARKLIFIYNHHDNSRKAIMRIKFDDYFQDIQVIDNFFHDDPKKNKMYIIDKNNSKNTTASIDANANLTTSNSSNNNHNHDVNKIESMILSIQTKKVIRIINALIGNILHEIKLFNFSDFVIIRSNGWRINRNNSDDYDGHHVNDDDDGRSSRNNDNIHGFFVTNDMNIYIYSTTYDDDDNNKSYNTNHSHIDAANSDYSAEYKHHHQPQEQQQQHYHYYQYHYHHQNKTTLSKNNIFDSLVKGLNIRNYNISSSSPSLTSPASSSSHVPLVIIWSFRKLILLHIKYKSRLNKIDVIKHTEYHVKSEYIRIVYASALPCTSNYDMMMMKRRNKIYKVMVVLSNGHMFVLTI